MTPLRTTVIILFVFIIANIVGNYFFAKRLVKNHENYNKAYVTAICEDTENSYASLFLNYSTAETIGGYKRTVKQCDDVEYTIYLCDYPEEHIYPNFVVFAEYTGDVDMDIFKWNYIGLEWIEEGTTETNRSFMGNTLRQD